MEFGLTQQKRAVASGHWPLMRYNPVLRSAGQNPFSLDSLRPSIPLAEYRQEETRYRVLAQSHPEEAERLMQVAQRKVRTSIPRTKNENFSHLISMGYQ